MSLAVQSITLLGGRRMTLAGLGLGSGARVVVAVGDLSGPTTLASGARLPVPLAGPGGDVLGIDSRTVSYN